MKVVRHCLITVLITLRVKPSSNENTTNEWNASSGQLSSEIERWNFTQSRASKCVKNVRASKNATEQTILGGSTSSAHVGVTTLTSLLRHNSQHLLPLTLVGLDLLQPGFDFVGEEGEEEWGGEFEVGCGVVVFVERDRRKTEAMLSNAARSHKVVNFRNAFWLVRNDMNTEYVVQDM